MYVAVAVVVVVVGGGGGAAAEAVGEVAVGVAAGAGEIVKVLPQGLPSEDPQARGSFGVWEPGR